MLTMRLDPGSSCKTINTCKDTNGNTRLPQRTPPWGGRS
jgi:hypothetical protein